MSEVEISVPSGSFGRGKKGFTLLELLIVILLLSLFAFLVFGAMERQSRKPVHPKISQIPQLLRQGDRPGTERELVCLEKCQRCFFLGTDHETQESAIRFPPLRAYIVDPFDQAAIVDFGRWKDKAVCLRIRNYSNGSLDRMILESEGKFYYIPSYFGKVETFDTLSAAVDRWLRGRDLFHDRGDYY